MSVVPDASAETGDGGPETAMLRSVPPPFADFYAANHRRVVALAWSLVGDRSGAEELAQDAFLQALRSWDDVGRYERPDAWVRRVVSNRAVSRFRRSRTERGALSRLRRQREVVAEAPGLPDEHEAFWRAVRALPARQAQCVALHYLEDRSVADIAEVLECSASTVKVHLHRGRLALAERLDLTEDVQ